MIKLAAVFFLLLCSSAFAEEFWVTGTGSGAMDGTSLANAWNNAVTWGTGAGQAGRGDTVHICGTVTAALQPGGIGAFDGVANASSDILYIDGTADSCGGEQGLLTGRLLMSGQIAVYVQNLSLADNATGGIVYLLGSATNCTASAGYYCIYVDNIDAENVGLTSNSTVAVGPQSNSSWPTSPVEAIRIANVTSSGGGGAACRVLMNATGAVIDNCVSTGGEGSVTNTWPIYHGGIFYNCGAANGGSGVTWTQVSGFVYKTTQTSCGVGTGKTILDVYSRVHAVSVPADLAYEAGCSDDSSCTTNLDAGEWGQASDTVYMNRGSAPTATAAIYLIYAWNTDPLITESSVADASDAYDGIGIGCDAGTTGCRIRQSFAENTPSYGIACTSKDCHITGSVADGFRLAGDAGMAVNVTSRNVDISVSVRTSAGETITVQNVAGIDATDIAYDELGEGTLVEANNEFGSAAALGVTAAGTTLSGSPLRRAGVPISPNYTLRDYRGCRFDIPPTIGAFEVCAGDAP